MLGPQIGVERRGFSDRSRMNAARPESWDFGDCDGVKTGKPVRMNCPSTKS